MRTTSPRSSVDPRLVAAVAALLLAAAGCGGSTCDISDDGNPAQRYEGGTTWREKTVNGFYESSPWSSGWLHFPGGKRYDLAHHLGFVPQDVHVMLSFSENGVGDGTQTDTAAQAAGNSGELQLVNDEIVRVKNASCTEFWIRVTAQGMPGDGGAPDAPDGK